MAALNQQVRKGHFMAWQGRLQSSVSYWEQGQN